jgi:hypothetical protein
MAPERSHDTLPAGRGSDPHGWRNALNYYGWGSGALKTGSRVDAVFDSFGSAMKTAVRQLIRTSKPVGMLGWGGGHAQIITGYYGLVGDPFAKDSTGRYTDAFTVGGFYLTDPLRSQRSVDRPFAYEQLRATASATYRFRRFYEYDSTYDDPYSSASRQSRKEWPMRFVLIIPLR